MAITLALGYIFILGSILGSYLNSWMWRVSSGFTGNRRSVCVGCRRKLRWYENVPVVSFIALRGKCRTCRVNIPLDYVWLEALTGFLFVGLSWYHLNQPAINATHFFRDIFFLTILLIIFVYDWKYQIILSGVVWGGALIGLVFNLLLLTHYSLLTYIIGALVGGGFFLVQYLVSKGRWIGGGDVRLGVMMGAWLGWPNILAALFVSYIVGMLAALPLLISKKTTLQSKIPFGTFLAMGTLVALLWGSNIIGWYKGMVGF